MLRALLGVAVDDGLLEANPFARVKLRLDDNSAAREVLTRQDLAALFGGVRTRRSGGSSASASTPARGSASSASSPGPTW